MRQNLTLENIKRIDKSDMLNLLLDFPLQFQRAYDIVKDMEIFFERRSFEKIVFAGVGGSAMGADLIRSYLYSKSRIPIFVVREYQLPAYVDKSTLVFIVSYSGNTEETLNIYSQAKEKTTAIITISSDGALKEYAQKDRVIFVGVPGGLPSRCALGYLSIIPLCILSRLGLIEDVKLFIKQTIVTLEELKNKNLNPQIGQKDNIAKYIANRLFNKFVVVYASSINFDMVATRFRSQLNENSKSLALSHVFPEACHEEIVGWQNPKNLLKNFKVVMFRDKDIYSRIAKKMDIVKGIIKKEGIEIFEIWSQGDNLLSKIFSLIYIGDFISFYLAILYGVDPTPVDKITYLKKEIARQ